MKLYLVYADNIGMARDEEFIEKLRSLNFGIGWKQRGLKKTTTDVHDHHTVDVVERWDDGQDVTVKPQTFEAKSNGKVEEHG